MPDLTPRQTAALTEYHKLTKRLGRAPTHAEARSAVSRAVKSSAGGATLMLDYLVRTGWIDAGGLPATVVTIRLDPDSAAPKRAREEEEPIQTPPEWRMEATPGVPVVSGHPLRRAMMILVPDAETDGHGFRLRGRPVSPADLVRAANDALSRQGLALIAYPGVAMPPRAGGALPGQRGA